jgi:hypothetical protein
MRRPVLLIFVNAMILIVVFALLTQSLVVIQRIAKADYVSGLVEVQRSGKGGWKTLGKGGLIKTGDVVRSSENGLAEFRWADGTRWKIMPSTEIKVKKSVYNMVKKADQSQLELSTGKVFIRIIKALGPSSKFEVETPTAVAAVRGTIFSVEVKNGKTEVAVLKGKVWLSSDGKNARAGEQIVSGAVGLSSAPGSLNCATDAAALSEFSSQKSIVLPQLEAQIKPLQEKRVLISGSTEAGNAVLINEKKVRVLGNGKFLFRAPLGKSKDYKVVAIDKHGARAEKVLSLPSAP